MKEIDDFNVLDDEIESQGVKLKTAETEIARLNEELSRSTSRVVELEQQVAQEKKTHDEAMALSLEQRNDLAQRLNEAANRSRDLAAAQEKLKGELEAAKRQVQASASDRQHIESELQAVKSQTEASIADLEKARDELASKLKVAKKQVVDISAINEAQKIELDTGMKRAEELTAKEDSEFEGGVADTSERFLFTLWENHPMLDVSFFGEAAKEMIAKFIQEAEEGSEAEDEEEDDGALPEDPDVGDLVGKAASEAAGAGLTKLGDEAHEATTANEGVPAGGGDAPKGIL